MDKGTFHRLKVEVCQFVLGSQGNSAEVRMVNKFAMADCSVVIEPQTHSLSNCSHSQLGYFNSDSNKIKILTS